MNKRILLSVMLVLIAILLTACGGSKTAGKWSMSLDEYKILTEEYMPSTASGAIVFEFGTDGTYTVKSTVSMNGEVFYGTLKAGTYTFKDDTMTLDGTGYPCVIKDNTMTLTDNGKSMVLRKSESK